MKPATQKNNQKPLWGCLLCKRNKPHQHEDPAPPVKQLPINKQRTLSLMQDVKRIFFPNYRGRWYTVRPIDE